MTTTTSDERDWMFLTDLVLASILSYLVNSEDCVRFSVVCKHWHSTVKHQTRNFPLAILPPGFPTRPLWGVYSVTQKRLLNFDFKLRKVPIDKEFRCYGSSCGWLAYAGEDRPHIIVLFNPFTQTETKIHLPPEIDIMSINKVILSADPFLHPNDYIVAVRQDNSFQAQVAWTRPGRDDHKWTCSTGEQPGDHIAFDKTGKWLYALSWSGSIERADLDAHSEQTTTLEMVVQPWIDNCLSKCESFLVETTLNKDLLLIFRLSEKGFKVFKLQDSSFVEVNDLNGDAVFLGHASYRAMATDFRGIEANCIYHMDECPHRIRKFNIKDKSRSSFDSIPNDKWRFAFRAYWIFATINL